jgi:hypothetical protein
MISPVLSAEPRPRARRGSVYVFVLGAAIVLLTIGLSVITVARLSARTTTAAGDVAEAEILAEDAVELALAAIATNSAWRSDFTSGTETSQKPLDNGTVSFKLVDEADGDLANNPRDSVRVYGYGRFHDALRIYSLLVSAKATGYPAFKTAAHAGDSAEGHDIISAAGGPLSSNNLWAATAGSIVNGNIQGTSVQIDGLVNGLATILTAPLSLPPSSLFDRYKAQATDIAFSSIPGGIIGSRVLSPAANPYGAANAKGIYHILVPSMGTLTISQSRLVATLLVTLSDGATFATSGSFLLEPPRPDYPTLLVRASTIHAAVNLGGSWVPLIEALCGVNFNPPGTPYPWPNGTSDTGLLGIYPAEFHGLLHVIGAGFTTNIGGNFTGRGTIITEGKMYLGTGARLTVDPGLYDNPPQGYETLIQMVPSSGTWRREVLP